MRDQALHCDRTCAVIVAGGTGERFGSASGKQMAKARGLSVLAHTIRAFDRASRITHIVVVCHPSRVEEYRLESLSGDATDTPLTFVPGGTTRADSVMAGLSAVPGDADVVAVHDGARPLITPEVINEATDALCADEGVDGIVVGHPVYDTLKEIHGTHVVETVDRSRYWVAQTPQIFGTATLRTAYERAAQLNWSGTDDASYVEAAGGVVRMFEGPRSNLKVTVAQDLDIVEALLSSRSGRAHS